MEHEALHFPDFTAPDFTQPTLEQVDLAQPGFVLLDPALSDVPSSQQLPLWPEDVSRPATAEPDPALPDLLEPDRPDALSYPAEDAHMLPEPANAPEVVMQQRPGELDPAALALTLAGPDETTLPAGLTYPQLYANDDAMTRRKRHFALLALGLEQNARDTDGN